jgi:hypothetical protein
MVTLLINNIYMNSQENKCVLIIDHALCTGVIANVAGILSITIGDKIKGIVGPDVTDRNGVIHPGLTQLPIPVLGATGDAITAIRNTFIEGSVENSFLVDFSSFAQQARTYEEYQSNIQLAEVQDIIYLGIALFADKKTINKATKGLALIS